MKLSKSFRAARYCLIERVLFFGRNSCVHGLKYVFDGEVNFFSRICWLSILLASTGCLYLLLMPIMLRANDVTFTPDTLYLHWTTTFPAVTVCETYNSKMAQRKFAKLYPNLTEVLDFDYRRYLTELIYGRGSCSRSVCIPCGDKVPCNLPWRNIVYDVHLKCAEILSTCSFNTVNFSCCQEFFPVDSEYGPCYSFNSLQRTNVRWKTPFVVNRTSGPGVLSFRLISDAQISIHSTEELSTNILDTKFKFDVTTQTEHQVDILFSVVEVENDPLVRFEEVDVRKCRYLHEVPQAPLHTYPVYSYGACRLAVDTKQSFKNCSCVHPARDKSYHDKYCNFTGLNCLVTYEAHKTKWGINANPDLEDCLPSCVESEITITHVSRRRGLFIPGKGTLVNIKMISLPTIRYKKDLLWTHLDLVVSVGGMVELFFSASILSIVEVFYLIFRTPTR